MFRRNDNAGRTGYSYEENLEKAMYKCRKWYKGNAELIKACCDYYQVDYCEVIRTIENDSKSEEENEE